MYEAMENRINLKEVLDFSVLKITPMALLALSNVFGMIGYYIPYVYVVRFATEHLDIEGTKAAWILSAIGISNVIGRLAFGLISDRFSGTNIFFGLIRISALFINNVCLLIAGLSVMAIPFCPSYWILMAISILFGFTISSYMSLTSIILVDILSLELLTTTFGLISCVRGLSAIAGPPLAGLLYDLTLSYTGVFFAAGSLLGIASLISFTVHRYEYFD
ncbi:monocarboxylate transporter 7-like [Dermatophagoides farinae]|uniref:monocarboxylate transporter 7-like n=1 Tax=Dermatophagoides farinae TaxID=6954 RepID=UPI003F62E227